MPFIQLSTSKGVRVVGKGQSSGARAVGKMQWSKGTGGREVDNKRNWGNGTGAREVGKTSSREYVASMLQKDFLQKLMFLRM